jgi:hypothetical protein
MSENQTPPQELYQYDGWLVFNELFTTEVFGEEDLSAEDVIEGFKTYEEGIPKDSQRGFKITEFPNHLQTMGQLSDELYEFAENIHSFNYVDEDWVEQWGFNADGEEQLYYLPEHDKVDIFWDTDGGVMMFRGDKQLLARKRKDLRGDLSGSLKIDDITFDFDFFLWVLYKKYKSEQLNSNLRVRSLTRGKTIGEREDNLGREVQVKGTKDVLKSVMLIAPLLYGKKIHSIQGSFIIGDRNQIKAEIHHEGKVHVKVTDSPLSGLNDLQRMGLSVWFLSELVHLYTFWENLDPTDRYPPKSFFDDLADNAEEEGWDLQFDPVEVKREYARKRQGTGNSEQDNASNPVGQ